MIGPHTKFVSVGHVNNTFGTINDVRRIIEVAHRYNVPVLIDGAQSIAVRAGHHCAQPALRALGYEMSVRPSFAFYNTKEEIDRLVIAVRKIIGRV